MNSANKYTYKVNHENTGALYETSLKLKGHSYDKNYFLKRLIKLPWLILQISYNSFRCLVWGSIKWFILKSYSEPCQTSKLERFAKIVDGFKPLTIFAKRSILDVRQGYEYVFVFRWKSFKSINFNSVKIEHNNQTFGCSKINFGPLMRRRSHEWGERLTHPMLITGPQSPAGHISGIKIGNLPVLSWRVIPLYHSAQYLARKQNK